MTTSETTISFIGLSAYSSVGGLQQFNRRVIQSLAEVSREANYVRGHLLHDNASDLPDLPVPMTGYSSNRAKFLAQCLSGVRSNSIILLAHINLLPIGWVAKLFFRRARIGLFVHGIEVWNDPIHGKKKPFHSMMLRSVDQIISVSEFTASVMSREYRVTREKFLILPNAVDPIICKGPSLRTAKAILAVTRLGLHDRQKNIGRLIESFSQVRRTHPTAVLEIVGDGNLRPELEALARFLSLGDSVRFLGRLSNAELILAYSRASVFALPSVKEGFGIVYLEAWQHMLPVICGDRGAAPEVVTDGVDGFVVDPDNIPALTERLNFLLANVETAQKMGIAGNEKVKARYLHDSFRSTLQAHLASMMS